MDSSRAPASTWPSHRRFASFASLHGVFVRDPPRDPLGSVAGLPAQQSRPQTLTLARPSTSPGRQPSTHLYKAATVRHRTPMAKSRRSLSLQAITPSFLQSPTSPGFGPLDTSPSSVQPTKSSTSPRASPPPSFLLDDDPFANLTGSPAEAHWTPPVDINLALQPRSPLTKASVPKSSTHSRSFSARSPTPAHQKPAFAPKTSFPSLDTLSRMNIVLTKKLRKGRVGAGLPFEPWDNPKYRRPSTSPTSCSRGFIEPIPEHPTSPTFSSFDINQLPSLVSGSLSEPPSDEPTFIQASSTITNGVADIGQEQEILELVSCDSPPLSALIDAAEEPNETVGSRSPSLPTDAECPSPNQPLTPTQVLNDTGNDTRSNTPVFHANPVAITSSPGVLVDITPTATPTPPQPRSQSPVQQSTTPPLETLSESRSSLPYLDTTASTLDASHPISPTPSPAFSPPRSSSLLALSPQSPRSVNASNSLSSSSAASLSLLSRSASTCTTASSLSVSSSSSFGNLDADDFLSQSYEREHRDHDVGVIDDVHFEGSDESLIHLYNHFGHQLIDLGGRYGNEDSSTATAANDGAAADAAGQNGLGLPQAAPPHANIIMQAHATDMGEGSVMRGDGPVPTSSAEGGDESFHTTLSPLSNSASLPHSPSLQYVREDPPSTEDSHTALSRYSSSTSTETGCQFKYSSVEAISDWRDATQQHQAQAPETHNNIESEAHDTNPIKDNNHSSVTSSIYSDSPATPEPELASEFEPTAATEQQPEFAPSPQNEGEEMLAYSSYRLPRSSTNTSSSSGSVSPRARPRYVAPSSANHTNPNQFQNQQMNGYHDIGRVVSLDGAEYDPYHEVFADYGHSQDTNNYPPTSYRTSAGSNGWSTAAGMRRSGGDDRPRSRRPSAIKSGSGSGYSVGPSSATYTTTNSSANVTSSESEEEEEEEEESGSDNVPLAQSIATALTAQKSIRKQVREERDQRRRERAGTSASAASAASISGGSVSSTSRGERTRQTTLRPAGVHVVPQGVYSSSQEAALHAHANTALSSAAAAAAPLLSRSGSRSKAMAAVSAAASTTTTTTRMGRPRTQTLPSARAAPTFSAEDLTRKLQDVQVSSSSTVTATSSGVSSAGRHRRYPSGVSTANVGDIDAYAMARGVEPFSPPAVPALPAEFPPSQHKTLRPQRSFHRPSPRPSGLQDDPRYVPALPANATQQRELHRARSSSRLRDDYTLALRSSGGDSAGIPAVPRLSEEYKRIAPVVKEPSTRSTSAYTTTTRLMESSSGGGGGYISDGGAVSSVSRRPSGRSSSTHSRRPSTADRERSAARPPVPPLPPSVVAAAVEATAVAKQGMSVTKQQQRIFIGDMQRYNVVEIEDTTSAGDVVEVLESRGSLKGLIGSGEWMVWEVVSDFGLERPIRHYERLGDVQASWNKDKLVNMFVVKLTPLAPLLARSRIPSSSPVHAGYVEWESKRGKWSKRWLQLREHSLWISKRDNGKDQALLCSLSNFDAYHFSRPYKSPKPFVFAIKSTDKLSFFENTSDYKHFLSCSEKDGRIWMEKILLARSYVLHQERNVLFNPKSYGGQPTVATAGPGGLARGATHRRPTHPFVSMVNQRLFEPGSLLHRKG